MLVWALAFQRVQNPAGSNPYDAGATVAALQADVTAPDTPSPASKRLVVSNIGDGYTEGTRFGGAHESGWPTLLAKRLHVDTQVNAMARTGYLTGNDYRPTFGTQLTTALASRPDVLLVVGGRSDSTLDPSQVRAAALDLFRRAQQAEPRLKIFAIGPLWDASTPTPGAVAESDAVRSAADEAGVTFVPALTWLHDPAWISQDGITPDNEGHRVLARRIVGILQHRLAAR